jgi:hypothetical protein
MYPKITVSFRDTIIINQTDRYHHLKKVFGLCTTQSKFSSLANRQRQHHNALNQSRQGRPEVGQSSNDFDQSYNGYPLDSDHYVTMGVTRNLV